MKREIRKEMRGCHSENGLWGRQVHAGRHRHAEAGVDAVQPNASAAVANEVYAGKSGGCARCDEEQGGDGMKSREVVWPRRWGRRARGQGCWHGSAINS